MPAYNFQSRFAQLIQSGAKRSTIRARRKNGYIPAAGDQIKLYTGQRTRNCRLLDVVTVKSVRPIMINQYTEPGPSCDVIICGNRLLPDDVSELAGLDGFSSVEEFFLFFRTMHGAAFSGYLIEW